MKFEDDFKEAISRLPSKEKDKLIHRLLRRDVILAKKLQFELLSKATVHDVRSEMELKIVNKATELAQHFYTPNKLTVDIRRMSSDITVHVKITKDKFGEASLNLRMLNETLGRNINSISKFTDDKVHKLSVYTIARAFRILVLIDNLDADYFIELQNELIKLGEIISKNTYLKLKAAQNGFDLKWLLTAEIPDNIADLYKQSKAKGFA